MTVLGFLNGCKHTPSKDMYPKSHKKSRWDNPQECDEAAGEEDAVHEEHDTEGEEEEDAVEEDVEVDPAGPPAAAPHVPSEPGPANPASTEKALQKTKPLLHLDSSNSIGADSTTSATASVAPTVLETPPTKNLDLAMLGHSVSGAITPSPVSLPVIKEVYLVADSPLRTKAEVEEDASGPVASLNASMSREDALKELATLEAELHYSQSLETSFAACSYVGPVRDDPISQQT